MAGQKGHKGQKPLAEGQQTKSTGIRLPDDVNDYYEKVVKELREKFPEKEITKSAVMRSCLIFYKEYAKQAYTKIGL